MDEFQDWVYELYDQDNLEVWLVEQEMDNPNKMMAQLGFRQGWYYQPLMGAAPMPGWTQGPNGTLVQLS